MEDDKLVEVSLNNSDEKKKMSHQANFDQWKKTTWDWVKIMLGRAHGEVTFKPWPELKVQFDSEAETEKKKMETTKLKIEIEKTKVETFLKTTEHGMTTAKVFCCGYALGYHQRMLEECKEKRCPHCGADLS